jgi:hypothetical protein
VLEIRCRVHHVRVEAVNARVHFVAEPCLPGHRTVPTRERLSRASTAPHGVKPVRPETERSELNNAVRSQFRARASVKAYLVLI